MALPSLQLLLEGRRSTHLTSSKEDDPSLGALSPDTSKLTPPLPPSTLQPPKGPLKPHIYTSLFPKDARCIIALINQQELAIVRHMRPMCQIRICTPCKARVYSKNLHLCKEGAYISFHFWCKTSKGFETWLSPETTLRLKLS